jgi:GNAT superfamily N-acetyltransferase
MKVTFRRSSDAQTLRALQTLLLPYDDKPALTPNVAAWIGWAKDTPVAFCTVRYWRGNKEAFLERAGVLPIAAGLGLQRRMIRLRERWAAGQGAECVVTYTEARNYQSLVNLLRCGYRFYEPAAPWGIDGGHYFRKDL